MKPLIVIIGSILTVSLAYAGPDLACEAVLEPPGDYCLADSTITPRLKISNLGDQGASNFFVKLVIVDPWLTGDTVYLDSVHVGYIDALPDYKEVEFPEWTPEGHCAKLADGGPFVEYELSGMACLGTDADYSNDTLRKTSTCLLAHDVGVTDLFCDKGPTHPPDYYEPGTELIFTATIENFGYDLEYDVPVRLEIWDKSAEPDTEVYQNIQLISKLNWRGDSLGDPYTANIVFPVFRVPSFKCFQITCKTELEEDMCPDDDIGPQGRINDPGGTEEDLNKLSFALGSVIPNDITFTLPLPMWVRLDVYDASGGFIRNLYNDPCPAGSHSLSWNGRDSRGTMVSSGAYFIKMQAGTFTASSKLIVIR